MIKNYLFSILLVIISATEINAQGTAGKEFWVAFMAQDWGCYYNNNYYNQDTAELFLSSQFAATVKITAKGQNFSKTVTLAPNKTTLVSLPREVVCRYSDSVTTNGVHIEADTTINVYAVNRIWYSKGATVVIPVTSIVESPEYFITTNDDLYAWNWYCNGKNIQSPEFAIVGIADSSVIEIVPTGASSRRSIANLPFQITLKKGETFQYITSDKDLTGSIIRSKYASSKYAVFAGNRQSFIYRQLNTSNACYSSWDHIYEQMMPTVTWGNEYTAMPFKNNVKGYNLKIVAAENNTRISIDGNYVTTLKQGAFYTLEVFNDTLHRITSNNRISVAQFAIGGYYCNNHPTKQYVGDPSMTMLFPDVQMGQSATINTVSQTMWWWWYNNWWWSQNGPEHHVNVMTRSSDTASFQINNKNLPNSVWKTHSTLQDYHYAQIQIDSGSHYLKSNRGFLAYVYGYSLFEGYGFAAAANFRAIQNNFLIVNAQCVRDTVKFQAILNDSFNNYTWKFGDGNTATGPKPKHKYRDTGWYTVKMYCRHIITNALDSVTKTLYVADTKIKKLFNEDTAFCGKVDLVIISKGFDLDNEYVWHDSHPVYYRSIKNPGLLWLEVKERNGCTFRDTFRCSVSGIPTSNFTASEEEFCFNRNVKVKFTNKSYYKDSIKAYLWDFGDTSINTRDTVIYRTFKKADTYPVILRSITEFDCYHDTFLFVNVLPSPKADFEIVQKDTCFNSNGIVFKNNTIVNKNDHRRFKWYFSEGFIISNSNPSGVRKYTDSGLFKAQLIYENWNACIDTMTQSFTILPNPKASFTFPNGTYCTRDSIPFTSNSYSKFKPLSYLWNWDTTKSIGNSSNKLSFTGGGNQKVKLSVWSPGGCKDTIVKSLFINETPLIDFTINNDTQCLSGHRFDFVNQTKFPGTLNYLWNISDGTSSTDSNFINKTFTKDSIYTVKLSTTSNAGCYAEKTKTIYLGNYPDAAFSSLASKQCFKGNAFTLSNTSTIKKGSINSYKWYLGNGDSASSNSINNYRYSTEDSFTVLLIAESNLKCYDTAKMLVVTHPQGKASFTVPSPAQCFDQHNFVFTNTSSITPGNLSYLWNFGDNTTATTLNTTKRYANAGIYTVNLVSTSNHDCKDTASKEINVFSSPVAGFNINNSKQCFRNNSFNFLISGQISNDSISNYYWDFGDNSSSNDKDVLNKSYNSEDTFIVQLILQSDQSCYDTLQKQVITFAQPKAQFNINNPEQCFNQQNFKYINASTIKYGKLNYLWQLGDGTISVDTNINKTYLKDSSYNVRLISSSDNACRDTLIQTILLNPSPRAQFTIDRDKQCFKINQFNFTNSSSIKKGIIGSYEWNMGNSILLTNTHINNYSFTTEDSFNVQLVAISDKNCRDTLSRLAITFAEPNVSIDIPNDSQCWQKNYFVIHNNTKLKYGVLTNSWDFGDNTRSTAFTPKDKVYPNTSASYTIKYKAVTEHGCSDSVSRPIALLERPISDFGINDSIQCFTGHLFSFTNKTSFSAMNTLSYWWNYENGNRSVGITPQDAVYSAPGQYPMELISYSSLTNCYDTIYKIIIPAPHANSDFTVVNDSQCLRYNKFTFNNISNVQFGKMMYEWRFGDGTKDTARSPVKSYLNEGSYTIKLFVNTNYNCPDSMELPVGFYATPKAQFAINMADQCFNKHSFDFTNQTQISRGNFTQEWYFDDLSAANSLNYNNKQFNTHDTHTIRLSVASNNNCTDTIFKTVYLENIQNSRIDFNDKDSQCFKGNNFDFVNTKTNPKVTYTSSKWIFGDGQESTLSKPSIVKFNAAGKYTVQLATVSALGCNDTILTDIVILPHPVVAFTADTVCFPEPVQFNNTSSIQTGNIASWAWKFGDGNISAQASPLHRYEFPGAYNVELIASSQYNCKDTSSIIGAVLIQEKPVANFKFYQLPTLEQDQTRLQFTNLSSQNSSTFTWDFGNFSNSNDRDPIGIYEDTGRYNVMLVAYTDAGCSDTAVLNTGMLFPDFFYFLPSAFTPNSDPFNPLYKGIGSVYTYKFKLEIYNRWGEKLFETDDINQGWDGYYNGELCMEGAYLCRVQLVPFKGIMKTYEQMFMLMR